MSLFGRNIALWIVILILLIGLFNLFQGSTHRSADMPIPYSAFLDKVEAGDVKKVTIAGRKISPVRISLPIRRTIRTLSTSWSSTR